MEHVIKTLNSEIDYSKLLNCLFFTFIISISTFGQGNKKVELIILDGYNKAIPYCIIVNTKREYGFLSDSSGKVTFIVPETDTLIVENLGYFPKKIPVKNISSTILNVKLDENPILLKEFVVKKNNRVFNIGISSKAKTSNLKWQVIHNFELCLYIKNNLNFPCFIKRVNFYTGFSGTPITPFRLKIYSVDKNKFPEKNLLKNNVIVSPKNKSKWISIDLEEYLISLPENGIAIGIEWLYPTQSKILNKAGPKIGILKDSSQIYFLKSNQSKWQKINTSDKFSFAPMINCDIMEY